MASPSRGRGRRRATAAAQGCAALAGSRERARGEFWTGSCPHRQVGVGVLGWCHHLGNRDEEAVRDRGGPLRWVGKSFHYDMEVTMKKGMNPEAVDQMSQQIQQAGEDALAAFNEVSGRVEGLDWTGEDRDRFVGEFNGSLLELAQRVKQTCDEFHERGTQNAAKQREASA